MEAESRFGSGILAYPDRYQVWKFHVDTGGFFLGMEMITYVEGIGVGTL